MYLATFYIILNYYIILRLMGKRYCFFCRDCELRLTLFDDVGKSSQNRLANYYCPNCEKIVYHDTCLTCNTKLSSIVDIPESILQGVEERAQNGACPRCKNDRTIVVFLGEWE